MIYMQTVIEIVDPSRQGAEDAGGAIFIIRQVFVSRPDYFDGSGLGRKYIYPILQLAH